MCMDWDPVYGLTADWLDHLTTRRLRLVVRWSTVNKTWRQAAAVLLGSSIQWCVPLPADLPAAALASYVVREGARKWSALRLEIDSALLRLPALDGFLRHSSPAVTALEVWGPRSTGSLGDVWVHRALQALPGLKELDLVSLLPGWASYPTTGLTRLNYLGPGFEGSEMEYFFASLTTLPLLESVALWYAAGRVVVQQAESCALLAASLTSLELHVHAATELNLSALSGPRSFQLYVNGCSHPWSSARAVSLLHTMPHVLQPQDRLELQLSDSAS